MRNRELKQLKVALGRLTLAQREGLKAELAAMECSGCVITRQSSLLAGG